MKRLLIVVLTFLSSIAMGQDGGLKTLTASGTDTYTITESLPATYDAKERFVVNFTNANTGAATLNRAGLGAKAIQQAGGAALSSGDIKANGYYLLSYNGTYYQIVGGGGSSGITALTGGVTASGSGSVVATVVTNANLTGHITSVGNSAVLGSFTKSQLSTAVSDGDPLYVGDVTQYTDEQAQDAVGSMVDASLTYVDGTPLLQRAALTGDITASAGGNATTLATVNSNVGSFGSSTTSLTTTVNGKGLITAISSQTVTPAVGSITGLGTGVGTALSVNVGSSGAFITFNGAGGTPSSIGLSGGTGLPLSTGVSGDLPFANLTQITGLSVLGVTGSSTADVAAITAGSDYNILRRSSSSSMGFGSIDLSQSGAVGSSILPIANGGTGSSSTTYYTLAAGGTASGANTFTMTGTNNATWNYSTLGASTGFLVNSNSTDAASNTQTLFKVTQTGANVTSAQKTYGGYFTNFKTGTTSTNTALYVEASGATANFGLEVGNGGIRLSGNNQTVASTGGSLGVGTEDTQTLSLRQNQTARVAFVNPGTILWSNSATTGTTPWHTFTQSIATSGTALGLLWTGAAHTSQATTVEITDLNFALNRIVKIVDGTTATQRSFRIQAPTFTPQTTAITLTDAVTLEVGTIVAGPGTTITRNWNTRFVGSGNVGVGGSVYIGDVNVTTAPTALLMLAAGTTAANTGPIKLTSSGSGVTGLLSTAEKGSMEFSDYGLWFSPAASTRNKVLHGLMGASAPATNTIGVIIDYYGTSATRVLTTPTTWISVTMDNGTVYKIPAY